MPESNIYQTYSNVLLNRRSRNPYYAQHGHVKSTATRLVMEQK